MNPSKVTLSVNVYDTDIDDIMSAAFEGGITYWAHRTTICKKGEEEWHGWASDAISQGFDVIIYDDEAKEHFRLSKEKMLVGIEMLAKHGRLPLTMSTIHDRDLYDDMGIPFKEEVRIDLCTVDADIADMIVQYGLFGELVYG